MLKNKLHPFLFLIFALIGIAGIFNLNNSKGYLLTLLLMLCNLLLLNPNLKWKKLGLFSLILVPALAAMFISSYWFVPTSNISEINSANPTQLHLQHSINLTLRLYSLALISFGFMLHMPKESVLLNLMQRKILSVKIGFSLLAVFNAFEYLANEFQRIQLAYKMRFNKRYLSPKILLPLLIAAARYAHNLSISMYNRGLNQERSYIQPKINFSRYDGGLILVNLGLITLLICFLN